MRQQLLALLEGFERSLGRDGLRVAFDPVLNLPPWGQLFGRVPAVRGRAVALRVEPPLRTSVSPLDGRPTLTQHGQAGEAAEKRCGPIPWLKDVVAFL